MTRRVEITTMAIAAVVNLALFFTKLYVGVSTGSLAIYCDGINNLSDVASAILVLVGFALLHRMTRKMSNRVQALCSFVIGLVVLVCGCYFIYTGAERVMYPTLVAYARRYALLIGSTIIVKLILGIAYLLVNRRHPSEMFKVLALESFLDCATTLTTLIGFLLIERVNFAVDGIFAIIVGAIVTVGAVRTLISQTKALITDEY